MSKPINPPPVTGGLKDDLPAYLSNGVIGLRVRDNPPTAGLALVSGLVGRHPERDIEAAALAPYPLALDIALEDVWLSNAPQAMTIVEQSYDFATAEVTTKLVFQPKTRRLEIEVVTFCSRDHPTLACQQVTFRLDGLARLVLRPMIDARGVEGRALAHERQTPGEDKPACDGVLLWETEGGLSTCGVAMLTALDAEADRSAPPFQRGRLFTEYNLEADQRRPYVLTQMVSLVPSAIHAQPDQHAVRLVALAGHEGFAAIREANRKQWSDLWRSRIQLIGAEPRWQALADAAFFYLMSSSHPSSPCSTSIFGLATWGEYHHYYGHVMWDVETFAVPPLTFLQPGAAQALLDYRSTNLAAAGKNAQARGRRGLQFPWESGPSTGQEAAPLPGTAAWHEDHVSPDVALAFALYAKVAGDADFQAERAWPVLSGVAEWIASRLTPTEQGYALRASMGVAERKQPCDNPAYAVFAIQAALDEALALAKALGKTAPPKWREIRDNLQIPIVDGRLVSHDGWTPDEEKGATPDPLMALFPLWRDLDTDVAGKTLDTYLDLAEQYVGSPMLSAFYGAWAAWRGDRERAAELFEEGYAKFEAPRFGQILEYRKDRFPEQPPAGPFGANMGAFLRCLIEALPGLNPNLGDPAHWPSRPVVLPAGWEAIRIDHFWARGKAWRLEARHGAERASLTPV